MKRKAFSLVELLIVILVIGIMAGLLFRLYYVYINSQLKSATVSLLEKIAFAVEDYRAEYGIYPPCDTVVYSVGPVGTTDSFVTALLDKPEDWPPSLGIYRYGLVAHLWPRIGLVTPRWTKPGSGWIRDTERDIKAKNSWAVYIDGVASVGEETGTIMGTSVTNLMVDIRDAWGHSIHYFCGPNYQTYRLWSDGATSSPADDLHRDKWDD